MELKRRKTLKRPSQGVMGGPDIKLRAKFHNPRKALLGEKYVEQKERKIIPNIVDTSFRSNAKGIARTPLGQQNIKHNALDITVWPNLRFV